jgi:predicted ABC-type ATPase
MQDSANQPRGVLNVQRVSYESEGFSDKFAQDSSQGNNSGGASNSVSSLRDMSPSRYQLSETENKKIFDQLIVPDLFARCTPQENPVSLFLVAQPGSGKSYVAAGITHSFKDKGGIVDIDSDLYKPYHPEYDAVMSQDDTQIPRLIRPDGRKWMERAHAYVKEHKLNALIQETSQNAQSTAKIIGEYRTNGFWVDLIALSVPKAVSDQVIINRYHEQVKSRGNGRLTAKKNADESYHGILDLATQVDESKLVDSVVVYCRGDASPRYQNNLDAEGNWKNLPQLRASIESGRKKHWTNSEQEDFKVTQKKLRDEMPANWQDRLLALEKLADVTAQGSAIE